MDICIRADVAQRTERPKTKNKLTGIWFSIVIHLLIVLSILSTVYLGQRHIIDEAPAFKKNQENKLVIINAALFTPTSKPKERSDVTEQALSKGDIDALIDVSVNIGLDKTETSEKGDGPSPVTKNEINENQVTAFDNALNNLPTFKVQNTGSEESVDALKKRFTNVKEIGVPRISEDDVLNNIEKGLLLSEDLPMPRKVEYSDLNMYVDPVIVYQREIAKKIESHIRFTDEMMGTECVIALKLSRDGMIVSKQVLSGAHVVCEAASRAAIRVGKLSMPNDEGLYRALSELQITIAP